MGCSQAKISDANECVKYVPLISSKCIENYKNLHPMPGKIEILIDETVYFNKMCYYIKNNHKKKFLKILDKFWRYQGTTRNFFVGFSYEHGFAHEKNNTCALNYYSIYRDV